MGFTRTTIAIGELDTSSPTMQLCNEETCEVLVDTGATYSTLPLNILKGRHVPAARKVLLTLADERTIERDLGYAWIVLQGVLIHTPVLFAENGDPALLGVIALEDANLVVDPVSRQLIKRQSYIQY